MLRDLEMFRDKEVKYTKTLNALDEQTQRRAQAEDEVERLRKTLDELQHKTSSQIDHQQRQLDDLKFNN